MPRFSVAFNKRKSTGDALDNISNEMNGPAQPSFRVIERKDVPNHSFDGGAKYSRGQVGQQQHTTAPRQHLDIDDDNNMFANLKVNRGSNLSNTTHATSDNSSRHSNASTAPSSADVPQPVPQENKAASPVVSQDPARGPSTKSVSNSLFSKAGRTFSFGGQKKQSVPPPKEETVPDLPPVLTLNTSATAPPGMLGKAASASPPSAAAKEAGLDLGGDFGAMFSGMDKRESMATVRNDAGRSLTNARPMISTSPEVLSPSATEPFLNRHSPSSDEDRTLSFKRSTPTQAFYTGGQPLEVIEDEDAKLLRDSFTAMKFLNGSDNTASSSNNTGYGSYGSYGSQRRQTDTISHQPSIAASFSNEDNMFADSTSRFARTSHRYVPRVPKPPKNRVMTPAQYEKYREDKERGNTATSNSTSAAAKKAAAAKQEEDEEEDDINYDDDEDEAEKSRQQTHQRRKQEAHMAVYRQQMMKVTGEPAPPIMTPSSRPGLPSSASAPQLNLFKSPSPNPPAGASDEDEDDEVPLAILQAHGFPAKNRPPTRLSTMPSNGNLNAPASNYGRPASVVGDISGGGNGNRRQSTLPAFARKLPQDPFVGAGVARPAIRESMSFHEGTNGQQQNHGALPPGGLVGVIANEERSRAMRRGSPNIDGGRGFNRSPTMPNTGFDPAAGMPHQVMYGQGGQVPQMAPGMPQMGMPQPMMSPGEQAQMQMNQQMNQFMQMQMQFMQMMAMNQGGAPQQGMPQGMPQGMHMPPQGFPASQSMTDLTGRQSVMGVDPAIEQMNHNMRTMSMVQPSSASMLGVPGYGRPVSIRGVEAGYAPSIAPSERSTVGLPGRYRPVSQATATPRASDTSERTATMSGAFPAAEMLPKSNTSIGLVSKPTEGSDDEDDEEGWEAMKARREKKRSIWRSRKSAPTDLSNLI